MRRAPIPRRRSINIHASSKVRTLPHVVALRARGPAHSRGACADGGGLQRWPADSVLGQTTRRHLSRPPRPRRAPSRLAPSRSSSSPRWLAWPRQRTRMAALMRPGALNFHFAAASRRPALSQPAIKNHLALDRSRAVSALHCVPVSPWVWSWVGGSDDAHAVCNDRERGLPLVRQRG